MYAYLTKYIVNGGKHIVEDADYGNYRCYIYNRQKLEEVKDIIRTFLETNPEIFIVIPLSFDELINLDFIEAFYGLEKPNVVQFNYIEASSHSVLLDPSLDSNKLNSEQNNTNKNNIFINLLFSINNGIRLQVIQNMEHCNDRNYTYYEYAQRFAPTWFEYLKSLIFPSTNYDIVKVFTNFHNKLVNVCPKIMAEFLVPTSLLYKLNDLLYFDQNGIICKNTNMCVIDNDGISKHNLVSLFPSCTIFSVPPGNILNSFESPYIPVFINCTKINITINCKDLNNIITLCKETTRLKSLSLNVLKYIPITDVENVEELLNVLALNKVITKLDIYIYSSELKENVIKWIDSYFKVNKVIEKFKFNIGFVKCYDFINFPFFKQIIESTKLKKVSLFPYIKWLIPMANLLKLFDKSIDVSLMDFVEGNDCVKRHKKSLTKLRKIAF